jgi:hypothetical protein
MKMNGKVKVKVKVKVKEKKRMKRLVKIQQSPKEKTSKYNM